MTSRDFFLNFVLTAISYFPCATRLCLLYLLISIYLYPPPSYSQLVSYTVKCV